MFMKDWFFQPTQKEVWEKIVDKFGGEFIEFDRWSDFALKFKHKTWSVYIDSYSRSHGQHTASYTRIRTLIKDQSSLRFRAYLESLGGTIRKKMGMQDIRVGDARFDKQFIVKGNNKKLIREFFTSDEIKKGLLNYPQPDLWLHDRMYLHGDKCPEGIAQVYLEAHGIDRDSINLLKCCELFCAVLDGLEKLNLGFEDEHEFEID